MRLLLSVTGKGEIQLFGKTQDCFRFLCFHSIICVVLCINNQVDTLQQSVSELQNPFYSLLVVVSKNVICPSFCNLPSLCYRKSPDKRGNSSPVFIQFHPRVTSWLEFGKIVFPVWDPEESNWVRHQSSTERVIFWYKIHMDNSGHKRSQEFSSPNFYSKQGKLWQKIRFLRAFHWHDLF